MAKNFGGSLDRTAVALMFGALTLLTLFLASLVPDQLKLLVVFLAGVFNGAVMAEEELQKSILLFIVCAVVGMLITSGFEIMSMYIFFCGWYAIAKFALDDMDDFLTSWCVKFMLYNGALALCCYLTPSPMFQPIIDFFPLYLLIPLAQVVLLAYDGLIWFFAMLYRASIRRYL